MNREEKITIISAQELNSSEKQEVLSALQENQPGKSFNLEYKIDESIVGGLQMYTETKFLDMSLKSRIDRMQTEITKI